MANITRKNFLRLTTAAVSAAAFIPSAKASQMAAVPKSAARATLIKGADLLTMDPTLKEMKGADILLENGKIAAIGPNLKHDGAEVINAAGMIAMPGMSDGHRHIWHIIDGGRKIKTEPRAYSRYQEWKMRTVVSMQPEDHYLACKIGGLMAVDSGVTSILDYAHGQINEDMAMAAAQGVKDSGVGGWFAFQLGVSSSYKPGDTVPLSVADSERVAVAKPEHWKAAERMQSEIFSDSSAVMQFALAPANGNGRTLAAIKEEWTRCRGMGVKILASHLHKTRNPMPEGHMGHRDSGIADLKDAGMLGPDYHVAHANKLTADELKMLADTGGMVCATAMGEFTYAAQPSFRGPSVHGKARAAGVATGIGIDGIMSMTYDYFEHARDAFWSLYLDPESIKLAEQYTSNDTLDFVTALGAKSLRLGDTVGTLTVGKRADVVLLRTDRIGFAMQGTLADRVLNFGALQDVDSVWIAGEAKKRGGQMIGVDWTKLKADLFKAQERIWPLASSITFTT